MLPNDGVLIVPEGSDYTKWMQEVGYCIDSDGYRSNFEEMNWNLVYMNE